MVVVDSQEEKKPAIKDDANKSGEEKELKKDTENPNQENPLVNEEVKPKSLEEEVREIEDKQYQAKVIVDLKTKMDAIDEKLNLILNKSGNNLLDSKAAGDVQPSPNKQKSELDKILEGNKGK